MKRPGRSPLFQQVKRLFRTARLKREGRVLAPRPGFSRREFMAASTAALLAAYTRPTRAAGAPNPRIAVVGGGIAGLNATYLLSQAGFQVTCYEGSDHTGGRIQTAVGAVADDITTELGGEFIDTSHEDMLSLANLFGLDLIDTEACSEAGLEVAYWGGGRLRTEEEVIDAFQHLAGVVDDDYDQLSDDLTFDSHNAFDVKMDHMSLERYFNKNLRIEWLYNILEAAYVNEYGLDLDEQSSINFIVTIGTDTSDGFKVYGESDQRFKILGGNQQVVDALADAVQNRIQLEHKLVSLKLKTSGEYQLSFDVPHGPNQTVTADIVILCIPFTILRNIDVKVPMPAVKKRAIQELGYGINAKLVLGFETRAWRDAGFTGDSYASQPYQSGWDSSRGQPGTLGAYTIYPGGTKAKNLGDDSKLDQAHKLLPGLQKVFPSIKKKWLGTALRAYWPNNPWIRASYAAYKPGQWTTIRGAEGMTVGNLYFAGEHTSLDWQGYMNGGAESGRLAAEAIIGV